MIYEGCFNNPPMSVMLLWLLSWSWQAPMWLSQKFIKCHNPSICYSLFSLNGPTPCFCEALWGISLKHQLRKRLSTGTIQVEIGIVSVSLSNLEGDCDERWTLETSALDSLRWLIYIISSVDKTKSSCERKRGAQPLHFWPTKRGHQLDQFKKIRNHLNHCRRLAHHNKARDWWRRNVSSVEHLEWRKIDRKVKFSVSKRFSSHSISSITSHSFLTDLNKNGLLTAIE